MTGYVDEGLEAALDDVGRQQAFDMANASGWSSANPPPKFIWWQIIHELMKRRGDFDELEKENVSENER